jgi:cytidylate kinase
MGANVVSLSVQTGSGGFAIARRVAESLHFRYYDWEITSEAAARAGVTPNEVLAAEHIPGFVERMMRRLGAASAVSVESGPAMNEISPAAWTAALQSLTADDYRQFVERIVTEIADQGAAVIVGHAAQHTLRGRPGTIRVLIHGSAEKRVERLAKEQTMPREEAQQRIKDSDKERGDLLKRVYHFDWLDASMYDLAVNTDQLSDEFVADTIVAAAEKVP